MTLIRSLDDPLKYVRKEHVAVFRPHRREVPAHTLADGTQVPGRTIEVTDDDLEAIAANVNRDYQADGQLVKLTLGHRRREPAFPEPHQPPVVGVARDYKAEVVQRPGGKALRLTHTEYIRRDTPYAAGILAGAYPERSPEYDPDEQTITGVALLTRDAWLKLGTVSYEAGNGRTLYAMGGPMGDDTSMDNPDDPVLYADFKKYMTGKPKCYAKYQGEMAAMGPGNGMTPPAGGTPCQAGAPDLAAEIAQLRDQLATERAARVEIECRAMLDPIKEFRQFDYARELKTLVSYANPADRAAHVKYIADNYLPTAAAPGGWVNVPADVPGPAGAAPDITKAPPRHDEILAYMRAKPGTDYQQAKVAILTAAK